LPDAKTVLHKWNDFVTLYSCPEEHWVHLRTSNPIESIFSGVLPSTDATKRMRPGETELYLVFKIIERLGQDWRALNGGENLLTRVLKGCALQDGVRQRKPAPEPAASAA
jgi:putative transposase